MLQSLAGSRVLSEFQNFNTFTVVAQSAVPLVDAFKHVYALVDLLFFFQ
jgi:hypothetical protein